MSAVPSLRLDDIGARELVDSLRERIPAESGGRWTLHAPVDPGITLLELFAYLLDQRVYWLDQVPDALLRGIFRLLGDAPLPSRPAATVVQLAGPSGSAVYVGRATRLDLAGSTTDVVFTTATDVVLLPVARVGLETFDEDRSEDLARRRGVDLLPADGTDGEARIVLHVATPFGAPARRGRFALFLRLDTPASVAPQWLAQHPVVPPPARVEWLYRSSNAPAPVPFPARAVDDGTGGLRRSGVVGLPLPDDWQPDAPPGADGAAPYSVFVRTDRGTFTTPPRVLEIVSNVVLARHVLRVRASTADLERQIAEWLPLPGRTLDLGAPETLVEGPAASRLLLRERDGRWRTWRATDDLAVHGPADRVYVVDRRGGGLRFGDGLTGRIPVVGAGAPRAAVVYEIGHGEAGNLGEVQWDVPARPALSAKSVVRAEGGRETETLVDARIRVGQALRKVERAVTADDYELLAESTPGIAIARAHAAIGFDPQHPCNPVPGAVTVFVVPDAPRDDGSAGGPRFVAAPQPDPGALDAVAARLERARLIGTDVSVRAPRYRRVGVAVTAQSEPGDAERLRERLEEELRTYLDPLVGGDEASGWPFGDPVRPSALMRRAQAALGTDVTVWEVAIGLDDDEPHESCRDVPIGEHELVVLRDVAVRWHAEPTQGAGLR